jgi:hypothetical protein
MFCLKMQAVLIGVHFVNNRTLEAKKMEREVVKDSTGFKGNHFIMLRYPVPLYLIQLFKKEPEMVD